MIVEPHSPFSNDLLIHRSAVPLLRWRRLFYKLQFIKLMKKTAIAVFNRNYSLFIIHFYRAIGAINRNLYVIQIKNGTII